VDSQASQTGELQLFNKYINIPYVHLGRELKGADCWGIVWLMYKEEKGIILPDNLTYKEFWYKGKDENNLLDGIEGYTNKIEVSSPFNPFDVILFWNKDRSFVDHIGVMIELDRFIHSYRGKSSVADRYSGYWSSRFYKGLRWHK
jgi:cell wall-associated NlpC family hydrolase